MLTRRHILELIPHQGSMCLLDEVVLWTDVAIACLSRTHLAHGNPLRRDNKLNAVGGIEYGLQAAALHGALVAGAHNGQAIWRLYARSRSWFRDWMLRSLAS